MFCNFFNFCLCRIGICKKKINWFFTSFEGVGVYMHLCVCKDVVTFTLHTSFWWKDYLLAELCG